jgi:hypothetical protein
MARAIPEAVLTGTLEVLPRPPWLVQCLQDVEVLVQVECLFYGLLLFFSTCVLLEQQCRMVLFNDVSSNQPTIEH